MAPAGCQLFDERLSALCAGLCMSWGIQLSTAFVTKLLRTKPERVSAAKLGIPMP